MMSQEEMAAGRKRKRRSNIMMSQQEVPAGRNRKRKRVPWSYERFLLEATQVHGDKYDYTNINPILPFRMTSRIPVTCRTCRNMWTPTIETHIGKRCGCARCKRITYVNFIQRAREIHGSAVDYSLVKQTDVKGSKSKIELLCTKCEYRWKTTINNHIHNRPRCPKCLRRIRWTYTRFLERALEIHGESIDYSKVRPTDVQNSRSVVQLVCNIESCKLKWKVRIGAHIYNQTGCPHCSTHPYTRDQFIERAREIHGDAFSYAQIQTSDIWNAASKVAIQCMRCLETWRCSVTGHIHGMYGCPRCNLSRGEEQCKLALERMGIAFNPQVRFADLGAQYSYDFSFLHHENLCLLEFDGQQHFGGPTWSQDKLERQQQNDIRKSLFAQQKRLRLIRIDFSCLNRVQKHLEEALRQFDADQEQMFYFSSTEKYAHIMTALLASFHEH